MAQLLSVQVDLTGYDHITKGVGFGTRTFVMVGSGLFFLAVLIGAVTFNRKAWICVELKRVPGTLYCVNTLSPLYFYTTVKLSLNFFFVNSSQVSHHRPVDFPLWCRPINSSCRVAVMARSTLCRPGHRAICHARGDTELGSNEATFRCTGWAVGRVSYRHRGGWKRRSSVSQQVEALEMGDPECCLNHGQNIDSTSL